MATAQAKAASAAPALWLLAQTAWPAIAAAQTPELPPPPADAQVRDDEIIVTGSRIPQTQLRAISPVTVIGAAEVRLQGTVLTEDLINSLPQTVGGQGSRLANGATGTATADLRGLGPSRTLVLINSRRLMPGDPSGSAADLNMIPAAMIERVEVLTGGASSVYGSDAIAGVVNFILDMDFEGLRVDAQYSFYEHDNRDGGDLVQALERRRFGYPTGHVVDGGTFDINFRFGVASPDGRARITAYAGYRHLDPILQARRDYSACVAQGRRDSEILDCGGSRSSANGTFVTRAGTFQLAPDGRFVPGFSLYNFGPLNHYQRPDERYVAGFFGEYDIDDAIEPYVEFMLLDDRSVAQIAPTANFANTSSINCDNVLLSPQQLAIACAPANLLRDEVGNVRVFTDQNGRPYARGVLYIARRNVEGGGRQDNLQHSDFRLTGGVRGELSPAWSYDAYYLFGRVNYARDFEQDFSVTRLERAIDVVAGPDGRPACRSALTGEDPACVPWNVFAPNAVDPAALDYLQTPALTRALVEQQVAIVSVTGQLGEHGIRSPWADEGAAINAGLEYRKDRLDYQPDSAFRSGDLAGNLAPIRPVSGSFDVREAFGEIRVPLLTDRLISELAIEAGYRVSSYDNGINRFGTDSHKFGLDFSPVPGVRFRASRQRAVRAPDIHELFDPQVVGNGGYDDPCEGAAPQATAAQCALTGVTAARYGTIPSSPIGITNALLGGTPGLDPERATTRTIGAVLQPRWLPGLAMTIDWYDIEVKDTISVIAPDTILRTCLATGDADFCNRIRRDRFGSLWITPESFIDATNTNIGSVRASGIDVGLAYRRPFGDRGTLDVELTGAWLDDFRTDNGGLSVPFDCAGLYGRTCGVPRPEWRHKARLTWSQPNGITLSLHWRHFSAVAIDRSSDQPALAVGPFSPAIARIPAQNYLDLTIMFRTGSHHVLRLGARNLLDREPPIVSSGPTADAVGCLGADCSGNSYPQIYDVLGRYIFAAVTLDF